MEVPKERNQCLREEIPSPSSSGLILVAFLGNKKFLPAISMLTSANNFSRDKKKLNNFLLNRQTLLNAVNFLFKSLL